MRHRASQEAADDNLLATLSSLESAVNYRDWILRLTHPYLAAPVLEVGAGRGTFSTFLAQAGSVTAIEPSERLAELLKSAVSAHADVTVVVGELADVPATPTHGSAVMFNVLEHIEDDGQALRQIHERLLPGSHLVIWVPAFQLLYSDFDRQVGHHRRYRVRGLKALAESSGFTVVRARYANAPGWLSWLVFCRILRANPVDGVLTRVFDRFLVPIISRVERVVRPPFGQSVFLVARKN
ncbi:MAG: class I SAM-dependent methyltransferase [Actinobacteria bacterium]|nr:class I SAM-dependent methyltransferase [Actinomycetota bacterium]